MHSQTKGNFLAEKNSVSAPGCGHVVPGPWLLESLGRREAEYSPWNGRIQGEVAYTQWQWSNALWFNRGTGPKSEIQCFSGLYLGFFLIVDKMNKYIF